MIKKILCVGDSFTFGSDLPNRHEQAWPALLAKNKNCSVTNLGVPGFSIDGCIRVLFENIDNNYDLIIFGCPPWPRQEVCFYNRPVTLGVRDKISIPWENDFYASYNDFYYYKKWLTNIIQIQHFLKLSNQAYLMHVTYELLVDKYQSFCKHLIDKLDKTAFLEFPETLHTLTKHLPIGPTHHPLEEGHIHIANLIQKQISHQMLI